MTVPPSCARSATPIIGTAWILLHRACSSMRAGCVFALRHSGADETPRIYPLTTS